MAAKTAIRRITPLRIAWWTTLLFLAVAWGMLWWEILEDLKPETPATRYEFESEHIRLTFFGYPLDTHKRIEYLESELDALNARIAELEAGE